MKITEDKKNFLKYCGKIGLTVLGLTGFFKFYNWMKEPTLVITMDANGDKRNDLLIQNRRGDYTILLQQADSTYIPLNNLPKKTRDSIEARLK